MHVLHFKPRNEGNKHEKVTLYLIQGRLLQLNHEGNEQNEDSERGRKTLLFLLRCPRLPTFQ